MTLVNTLAEYIKELEEKKEKELEKKMTIPPLLDSYLKIMG